MKNKQSIDRVIKSYDDIIIISLIKKKRKKLC